MLGGTERSPGVHESGRNGQKTGLDRPRSPRCAARFSWSGGAEESSRLPDGLKRGWYVRIDTGKGEILARLLPEQAPRSVATFTALAQGRLEWTDPFSGEKKKGRYYDGLPVALVSAGRMFVAGDRSHLGEGTPEIYVPLEGAEPVTFSTGLRMGMVRSGGRVSGVLFFVTASALREMDGLAPCFGEVVSGKETIFQISQVKTHPDGAPLEPIVIERVEILPVGDPPPAARGRDLRAQAGQARILSGRRAVALCTI